MSKGGTDAPAQEARWVPIADLTPWDRNPRKNDAAVPKVAESIRRFGWGNPALVRPSGDVIAGHTRLLAVELLSSLWAVECDDPELVEKWHPEAIRAATKMEALVREKDLDEREARLLALADNRTAEEATWDRVELGALLREIAEEDLPATGFDLLEIADLVEALIFLPDGDLIPDPDELDAETVIEIRLPSALSDAVLDSIRAAIEPWSDDVVLSIA